MHSSPVPGLKAGAHVFSAASAQVLISEGREGTPWFSLLPCPQGQAERTLSNSLSPSVTLSPDMCYNWKSICVGVGVAAALPPTPGRKLLKAPRGTLPSISQRLIPGYELPLEERDITVPVATKPMWFLPPPYPPLSDHTLLSELGMSPHRGGCMVPAICSPCAASGAGPLASWRIRSSRLWPLMVCQSQKTLLIAKLASQPEEITNHQIGATTSMVGVAIRWACYTYCCLHHICPNGTVSLLLCSPQRQWFSSTLPQYPPCPTSLITAQRNYQENTLESKTTLHNKLTLLTHF